MSLGSNYNDPLSILWEKALTLFPALMAFLLPLRAGRGFVLVFLSEKDSVTASSSSFKLQLDSSTAAEVFDSS